MMTMRRGYCSLKNSNKNFCLFLVGDWNEILQVAHFYFIHLFTFFYFTTYKYSYSGEILTVWVAFSILQ